MKLIIFMAFFSWLALGALFCSEMSVAGNGGSSETINAKVIVSDSLVSVTDNNGEETGLILEAYAADYRPYEKIGYTATLDYDKDHILKLPSSGNYNFLVRNRDGTLAGFINNIRAIRGTADTVNCTLTSGCNVNGKLISQDSDALDEQYAVSIYGSPFVCVTDKNQAFSIKSIPDGSYTMSVRPVGKRLFIATARYSFSTNGNGGRTHLDVAVP